MIYEVNYFQQQKRIGEQIQIIPFSHIVIVLNPAGKRMVRVNDRNIGNGCSLCLKLTIKAPE